MSFLSIAFVLFVAVTLIAFHSAPVRFKAHVLLAASLAFYATHGPGYLVLLVTVALGTQGAALLIERANSESGKKRILSAAVAALILLLCTFKLGGALDLPPSATLEADTVRRFVLPLGLSYYLFKLLSYLLEVYWDNVAAQRNWVSVGLYAAFFPQIVSGPIQRPGDFFAQLARVGQPDPRELTIGLRRILFGLFKKVAIADRLGPVVAAIHANPEAHSQLELLFGAYAYAIQLYADFSGLTDIALGIGLLFGIKGPENFALPFFARNLQEYWRRWHMSLTSWLADYLFTPVRMALRDLGQFGLAAAVFLNMVAVGIWHGFTGPFLAFGVFHGVALTVSVLTLKQRDRILKARPGLALLRKIAAPLVTFHLVVLGFIFFRAESVPRAVSYLSSLAGTGAHPAIPPLRFQLPEMPWKLLIGLAALVALMEAVHAAVRSSVWSERCIAAPRAVRWAAYYGLIILTLAFSRFGEEGFIYGQF